LSRLSIYGDEPWDRVAEKMRIRTRFFGGALGAKELGASLHELLPGSKGCNLHAHYGVKRMFFVLSGTPTLRRAADDEAARCPSSCAFHSRRRHPKNDLTPRSPTRIVRRPCCAGT
jgi:uncharacterized cupin superfamily protein